MSSVVVENSGDTVTVVESTVEIITAGLVGPQGPQGPAGPSGGATITMTAGESLGGQRAVVSISGEAFYADNTNPSHINRVIGVTNGAANVGQTVQIIASGESFGWAGLIAGDPIFISTNGTAVQAAPATGFLQQIGTALTSTSVSLNINISIAQV